MLVALAVDSDRNGSAVKSRATQLRHGLLEVIGVIEYPDSDGSYFRSICHL
jgi:hypothetical protein